MKRTTRVAAIVLIAASLGVAWAGKPGGGTGGGNQAPTALIVSPASGTTYPAPASITISAQASDSDGSIAKIEFYQGSALVGSDSSAPYTVAWSYVPAGSYSLTAKSFDNLGASTVSAPIAVTVSGNSGLISTPASSATIYGVSTVVTGTFEGDPLTTTVLVDNGTSTRVATRSGTTYSTTIPLTVGSNDLTVVATHPSKTSESANITVTGALAPVIAFVSPGSAPFAAPANFELYAEVLSPMGSIAKLDFLKGATLMGSFTAPPYRFQVSDLPRGQYSFVAKATDNNGVTAQVTKQVSVIAPNAPPSISLVSPPDGYLATAPAQVLLQADASDSDGYILRVEFLRDGALLLSDNTYPYSLTWSNVAAGTYAISARAIDGEGAVTGTAASTITIAAPNNPPSVTLTEPSPGAHYIEPANVTVSANASDSDGSVARVDFYQGSTLIGTASEPPYSIEWTGVAAGNYSLSAKAIDNGGAIAAFSAVGITVAANEPPAVTLVKPGATQALFSPATIDLEATATDADGVARVEFYAGTALIASVATSPYTFRWSGVVPGSYSITAMAFDAFGAVGQTAAVAVSVREPSMTILSPADGAFIAGDHASLRGTIDAPFNSGVMVNGEVAALDAQGRFYFNARVEPGANIFTLTLSTQHGERYTRQLTINSDGAAPFLDVQPPELEAVAPAQLVFTLTNRASTAATINVSNGAPFEIPAGGVYTYTALYTFAANYSITFTAEDGANNVAVQQYDVVVHNPVAMDQKFTTLWNGMHQAVTPQDIDWAVTYLSGNAREKYRPVFELLMNDYPEIVQSFSTLHRASLAIDMGECAVNRMIDGRKYIFFIYYVRGPDGIWRLDGM